MANASGGSFGRRSWGGTAVGGLLLLVLAATGAARAADFRSILGASSPATARVYQGKAGPWGQLEYTRIAIAPPVESVQLTSNTEFLFGTWVFTGTHRSQVEALFQRAELKYEQLKALMTQTAWESFPEGTVVRPSRDIILGLSPKSRHIIYAVLGRMPENQAQAEPFVFHPEHLDECFEGSNVSTGTITAFKQLLYTHGRLLLFADADPFMATIPNYEERLSFLRSISRRFTLLARLLMKPDTNVEQVSSYWDFTGRHKELTPLLESLTRVPGGTKLDLVHLLPQFARKRIYTFPPFKEADEKEPMRNCHWSALNFFNETADDRFCDPAFIQETVLGTYDRVTTGPYQMGDLMVLADSKGDTIHSAVYLADDIVYTKNGAGPTQPWLYMHLPEVLDLYASSETAEDPLQMLVFRRRGLAH